MNRALDLSYEEPANDDFDEYAELDLIAADLALSDPMVRVPGSLPYCALCGSESHQVDCAWLRASRRYRRHRTTP